jgi:hypothetical protein
MPNHTKTLVIASLATVFFAQSAQVVLAQSGQKHESRPASKSDCVAAKMQWDDKADNGKGACVPASKSSGPAKDNKTAPGSTPPAKK